jgi:hypothetical protein
VELQGWNFCIDFYILPLEGYGLVLGTQRLRILGPFWWDFKKLRMKFIREGKEVMLYGLNTWDKRSKGEMVLMQTEQTETKSNIVEDMEEGTKEDMQKILEEWTLVFVEPKELPPPRTHDHRILLLQGAGPVCVKPYRYLFYQKTEIEEQAQDMLNRGVICPSNSLYSSPVFLVKKGDGTWRMCVDYWELNKITIKDKFPILVIDELLDELHGAKFFTKLDLCSGYHQVRVEEEDIAKPAFRTHHGHYEFLVMPFGLTNVPSTFQALMNEVFRDFLHKYVLVFFDDILIYSINWAQHLEHVKTVLRIIDQHKLYLRRSKCIFRQPEVQ